MLFGWLPSSVALVVLGFVAARLVPDLARVPTPELVLVVLLPGLLFDAAFRLEAEPLREHALALAVLAVPVVLLTAFVVAGALALAGALPFALALLVGVMVGATDPAAVVSVFHRVHAPTGLRVLVEGESLLNDGTALVLFAVALRGLGSDVAVPDEVGAFGRTIVASSVVGVAGGALASLVIATVRQRYARFAATFAMSYLIYFAADELHQSGILAVVAASIFLGAFVMPRAMSAGERMAFSRDWSIVGTMLTGAVFLLVGFAIAGVDLAMQAGAAAVATIAALIARAVGVYGFLGAGSRLLAPTGIVDPLPTPWLHVLAWSGLRGAVAVAIALSLPADLPRRGTVQAITYGLVLVTIVLHGTTVGWLARRLGLRGAG